MLVGGRVSVEDAYAYGKFARIALHTNDIDFRARPHSVEEADFLAQHVVATGPDGGAVTYADLEDAKAVLLVGFEPEDESPIVFLRLRKGVRSNKTHVYAVAPFASRGLDKLAARLLPTRPGSETTVLRDLGGSKAGRSALEALQDGGVVLVGERLATVPGALTAAAALAESAGAKLAWIPRRAGERGALEAGALAQLVDEDGGLGLEAGGLAVLHDLLAEDDPPGLRRVGELPPADRQAVLALDEVVGRVGRLHLGDAGLRRVGLRLGLGGGGLVGHARAP